MLQFIHLIACFEENQVSKFKCWQETYQKYVPVLKYLLSLEVFLR